MNRSAAVLAHQSAKAFFDRGATSRPSAAVVAGLTLDYNSGAVEGTMNRVKQLKAAMYWRASCCAS